MKWNVLVKNFCVLLTGSWVAVLRRREGTLYLIYALYHQAACRISTSFSRDFAVWRAISAGFVTLSLYSVFFLKKRNALKILTKKMWVRIFDVTDDWRSDNRCSTVYTRYPSNMLLEFHTNGTQNTLHIASNQSMSFFNIRNSSAQ